MAQDDTLGLEPGLISEPPGSETLGIAEPVTPSQPAQQSLGSRIFSAIEAFGAGIQGRTPLYIKQREEERTRRIQNLQETQARINIAEDVQKQVQVLPEDKRQGYVDALLGQYDDPELKSLLKQTLTTPDLLSGYGEALQKDPMARSLAAKSQWLDFVKTEAGQKYVRERQFPGFAKEWSSRMDQWTQWTRENRPEVYEKALKDGRLTTTELGDILDGLPENLKPTPQSRSYFFTPDGQKRVSGVIGLPVITDETAQKKLERELEGSDATQISKLVSELEEAERTLAGAEGKARENAQRRVDAIKKKITSESRPPVTDALKEMRNQIVLKTAKLKERDPTYKPPAHEQYVLDEFAKADSFERLRREILEGRGDESGLPQISSDEEFDKLPSGAEYFDTKNKVKRRKP